MNLYFLRHAIAVPRGTPGYEDDGNRPLTPQGEEKMERIARGMKSLELSFDLILSSSYLRAKRTAEIVARIFGARKKLKLLENLTPEASPELLIEEIKKKFPREKNLLLVGHEPFLSSLISVLLEENPRMKIDLKKGGLCKLSADALRYGQCATLDWLLAPRHLVRIR